MSAIRRILSVTLIAAISTLTAARIPAQTPAPAPQAQGDPWPRRIVGGTGAALETFLIYQPQLDRWTGNQLEAHAAVSVQAAGSKDPTFGVIWFTARTEVDKVNRLVYLEDFNITRASFPSAPAKAATWRATLQEQEPSKRSKGISLDRLEADLGIATAQKAGESRPLNDAPPQIIFSNVPAVLVLIDGTPSFQPVKGTDLQRAINTSSIVLKGDSGLYLHLFDGWMEASGLAGPWSVSDPVLHRKHELDKALQQILAAKDGDPMTGGSASDPKAPKPSLKTKPVPVVYMATQPTELVVVNGEPNYDPISGTQLLYVTNTTGRVFKDLDNQNTYVLIAGRWFTAATTAGPWQFVPASSLPPDFAKIPDESPVENVKASVPGTTQAQEAVISNGIPQTATVQRTAQIKPVTFDGAPQFKPIEGTSLQYVVNASTPIIMTGPYSFFACQSGIWFTSSSVNGPWTVAAWLPASIYTIPPSSPLYNLTYVQVYGSTTDVVYVGYTPGYTGAIISDGVVVYGTGYVYTPWIGTVWYGPPVTYGYGVNLAYTPWTGWGFAFGIGCGFAMGAAMCGYGWGYAGLGLGGRVRRLVRALWRRGVGLRRRRRLGARLRPLVFGQCVQPVGLDERRHAQRRRVQRVDGQRVARLGRRFVQLRDRGRRRRPARRRLQRLHGQLRGRRARRGDEYEYRRERLGRPGHGGQRLHRQLRDGRARSGHRSGRKHHFGRGNPRRRQRRRAGRQQRLRRPRRERLQGRRGQRLVAVRPFERILEQHERRCALEPAEQLGLGPLVGRQPLGRLQLERLWRTVLGRRRRMGRPLGRMGRRRVPRRRIPEVSTEV